MFIFFAYISFDYMILVVSTGKTGVLKMIKKILFISIRICHYFDWQSISVDVSAIVFVTRGQALPKQVNKIFSPTIPILISMRKWMSEKRRNFCLKFNN